MDHAQRFGSCGDVVLEISGVGRHVSVVNSFYVKKARRAQDKTGRVEGYALGGAQYGRSKRGINASESAVQ
jgi:hypothetical protein